MPQGVTAGPLRDPRPAHRLGHRPLHRRRVQMTPPELPRLPVGPRPPRREDPLPRPAPLHPGIRPPPRPWYRQRSRPLNVCQRDGGVGRGPGGARSSARSPPARSPPAVIRGKPRTPDAPHEHPYRPPLAPTATCPHPRTLPARPYRHSDASVHGPIPPRHAARPWLPSRRPPHAPASHLVEPTTSSP